MRGSTKYVRSPRKLRRRNIGALRDERFRVDGGSDVDEAVERTRKKGDLPEHISALAANAPA